MMRKTLCTLLLALLGLTAMAQRTIQTFRLDSLAAVRYGEGKYEEALSLLYRELDLLDQPHPDSLYLDALLKIGQCYERMEVPMKAIEVTKRAIDIYQDEHHEEDFFMARLQDRLAVNYQAMGNTAEAYLWSQKAVELTHKYPGRLTHRINHLSHAAQLSSSQQKPAEAARLQEEMLRLVEQRETRYSEHYLAQLNQLKWYYDAASDTARATQLAEVHHCLSREIIDGIIPADTDLSTPEKCRRHRSEALLCSKWFLSHYLTTEGMAEAARWLVAYRQKTPDVAVYFGPVEQHWVKTSNPGYQVAYIAASVEYALQHRDEYRYTFDQYRYAINRVIDYYKDNQKTTGWVQTFDQYLRLRKKDAARLDKRLQEDFEKYKAQMRSRQGGVVLVDTLSLLQFGF